MTFSKLTRTTTVSIFALVLSLTAVGVANAAPMSGEVTLSSMTTSQSGSTAGSLQYTGPSTILMKPAAGVKIDLESLTVSQNGKIEKLPRYATDKNNVPVELVYHATNDGIRIDSILRYQDRGFWQCLTGIGGGAVTGGGTLGLGGAAVGTVTIPFIGTVSGGVVGAVVGAVGGGLTGAATFCW